MEGKLLRVPPTLFDWQVFCYSATTAKNNKSRVLFKSRLKGFPNKCVVSHALICKLIQSLSLSSSVQVGLEKGQQFSIKCFQSTHLLQYVCIWVPCCLHFSHIQNSVTVIYSSFSVFPLNFSQFLTFMWYDCNCTSYQLNKQRLQQWLAQVCW